ncbi:hypothetical protein MLD38_034760 [Melastoma candidum]|uniref:Uncharacterized protein n=1 Tax=Melastoma candidum TaxID=119954 RepID=A0ACB9MB25_9MYRT|nr:hypothetical protein MLD38_034760 [Melastoma candidum]
MSDWILEESASLASHGVENAERALCTVVTNGVEVFDGEGKSHGTGVYVPEFSWINHSWSPTLAIALCSPTLDSFGSEPRVIVRSILPIRKGEEVTIAYTDLLQPKAMQMNLPQDLRSFSFSKTFKDICGDSFSGHVGGNNNMCDVVQRLSDFLDNAVQDYLSESDPRSCCEKLETLLVQGILEMDCTSVAAQQSRWRVSGQCCRCSFVGTSWAHCFLSRSVCPDTENMSTELISCTMDLASKIWGSLASDSQYFQAIKHPINFEWLR